MSAAAAINRFLGASPVAQTPNHIPEVGKMVSAPERTALVELMAEALYNSPLPKARTRPWWWLANSEYGGKFKSAIQAALAAAEAAGWVLEKRG